MQVLQAVQVPTDGGAGARRWMPLDFLPPQTSKFSQVALQRRVAARRDVFVASLEPILTLEPRNRVLNHVGPRDASNPLIRASVVAHA